MAPPRTLAELLGFVENSEAYRSGQARVAASAIRSIGRWLDRPLEQLPTDLASLRRHLATLNASALGITPARLANARSLLNGALTIAGVRLANRPIVEAVTPEWATTLDLLARDRYLRGALAPLARFCSAHSISPDAVDDGVTARYLDFLEQTALLKHPRTMHQTTCRSWNQAHARCPAGRRGR